MSEPKRLMRCRNCGNELIDVSLNRNLDAPEVEIVGVFAWCYRCNQEGPTRDTTLEALEAFAAVEREAGNELEEN